MPMYDRICQTCGATKEDCFERMSDNGPIPCICVDTCDGEMLRGIVAGSKAHAVVGDDIPGGMLIKNGICNDDGTPKRYYSKTEIREAAKAKGLRWGYDDNQHVVAPRSGSDKNAHTRRWT